MDRLIKKITFKDGDTVYSMNQPDKPLSKTERGKKLRMAEMKSKYPKPRIIRERVRGKSCGAYGKRPYYYSIIYYVLSYGKDMVADKARATAVYEAGAMPFMQLYQPYEERRKEYPLVWQRFQRQWSRPAAVEAYMKTI